MSNDSSPDGRKIKDSSIPQSDAVLNCPACLTTLCLDCQRHELYTHQYRAMFVLNCSIIRAERLKYSVPQKMGRKWRKKHKMQMERADASSPSTATNGSSGDQQEYFHPVRCSKCNTEVAVFDSDEVYHFFNVLTSLSWSPLSVQVKTKLCLASWWAGPNFLPLKTTRAKDLGNQGPISWLCREFCTYGQLYFTG